MRKLFIFAAILAVCSTSPCLAQNGPSNSQRVQGVPAGFGDPVQVTIRAADGSAPAAGGDASAANQTTQITAAQLTNTTLGAVTASPTANTIGDRLKVINTTLGTPLQAGGTVTATQSGTWNLTNISGTISLPTGAATSANQTTLSAQLPTTLGQKTGANSFSVVWASDATLPTGTNTIGTVLTKGTQARAATVADNPLIMGGRGSATAPTAVTTNQVVDSWMTLAGATVVASVTTAANADGLSNNAGFLQGINGSAFSLSTFGSVYNGTTWDRQRGDVNGTVTQPYAVSTSRWSYAAASGGISNTTTAVTVKAAAGGSVINYVTGIQCMSGTLGAATEIAYRDGAGGTVLWRGFMSTAGGMISFAAGSPLKGTANTLGEIVTLSATVTGAVYCNLQGYTAL